MNFSKLHKRLVEATIVVTAALTTVTMGIILFIAVYCITYGLNIL